MRAILVVCVAGALPLAAQYYGLATPANGEGVYFSTSLRQTGTEQPQHSKIFRATEEGISVAVSVERDEPPAVGSSVVLSNSYLAANPQLDEKGQLAAYDLGSTCRGSIISCISDTWWRTHIGDRVFPGTGTLSRNGRFLGSFTVSSRQSRELVVTDLLTNTSGPRIPGNYTLPYFAVGDDGSAMLSIQTNGFYWVPPGAGVERSVRLSAGGRPLAIHQEGGETIVYFGASVVYRVNPRTGERRSIPVPSGCEQLQVEPQSRIFAVCEKNQLVEFSAGRARVWLTDNHGVSSYVVAASADVAWYTTGHGELKKFSLASGKSVRVVRPVTEWHFPNMTFVPGDLHEINSRTAFHGAGNARIRMNGLEAPIVSVEPERIRFQIPWDVAAGPAVFEASGFAESEFELASVEIPIQRFAPNYFVDRKPAFVHGDWRGLITESDPARPGEVIHVFLTGLGPVSPPWPLGTPAPDDATHKITAGIGCDMAPYKSAPARTVEVLYAGLAPGTIGFFQVSMQIPADEGSGYLTCRLSDGAGNKGEFEHYLTLRQ